MISQRKLQGDYLFKICAAEYLRIVNIALNKQPFKDILDGKIKPVMASSGYKIPWWWEHEEEFSKKELEQLLLGELKRATFCFNYFLFFEMLFLEEQKEIGEKFNEFLEYFTIEVENLLKEQGEVSLLYGLGGPYGLYDPRMNMPFDFLGKHQIRHHLKNLTVIALSSSKK